MSLMSRPSLAAVTAAALLVAAPSAAAAGPAGTGAPTLRSVLGTVPAYVHRLQDQGATAAVTPVRAMIALRHRDQAGLDALIAAVSDPSSRRYGDYLSPAAFERRFAPTDAQVSAVQAVVHEAGLKVTGVPRNNAYVMVSGTAAQAQRLFHTTLRDFSLDGARVHAPTSSVRLPAQVAALVSDVKGLDSADVVQTRADAPPAFVNVGPCSTSWAQSTSATPIPDGFGARLPDVPCGYSPQQLQGAYGIKQAIAAGLDGRGQRVAIVDAFSSPRIVSDTTTWSRMHGLPDPVIEIYDTPAQRNTPQGPKLPLGDLPVTGIADGLLPDPHGWAGEETLDVEAVHAMAPGATIVYQGANSAAGLDFNVAQNAVVANKRAQIISNSYGRAGDDTDPASDAIWQQAAAQGIGVYFATGDNGDESGGTGDTKLKSVGPGGNSPLVTAVGGTTLAVGPKDEYQFETYWGTFTATLTNGVFGKPVYNSGGGGGTSQVYEQPDYQKDVVPDGFANFWKGNADAVQGGKLPGRVLPDVSMLGDPNSGFLIGLVQNHSSYKNLLGVTFPGDDVRYNEYRLGGTSLSSPLFAGVMALADQAAGKAHGFANPALYAARTADAYRDVTAPAAPVAVIRTNYRNSTNADDGIDTVLRTAGNTGGLKSVPGFDDSTGLGSPKGLAFLRALAPGSKLIPADPATPGSCTPPKQVRFKLGTKRQRVVSLQVRVAGRTTITRRGRRLTAVTVVLPKGKRTFSVAIRTRTAAGLIRTSTRTFTEGGCKRSAVKLTQSRTKLRG